MQSWLKVNNWEYCVIIWVWSELYKLWLISFMRSKCQSWFNIYFWAGNNQSANLHIFANWRQARQANILSSGESKLRDTNLLFGSKEQHYYPNFINLSTIRNIYILLESTRVSQSPIESHRGSYSQPRVSKISPESNKVSPSLLESITVPLELSRVS